MVECNHYWSKLNKSDSGLGYFTKPVVYSICQFCGLSSAFYNWASIQKLRKLQADNEVAHEASINNILNCPKN